MQISVFSNATSSDTRKELTIFGSVKKAVMLDSVNEPWLSVNAYTAISSKGRTTNSTKKTKYGTAQVDFLVICLTDYYVLR